MKPNKRSTQQVGSAASKLNKSIAKQQGREVTLKKQSPVNKSAQQERVIDYSINDSYKFVEPAVKGCEGPLSFTATHFLRTHSKNDDPADVQTQVWECLFEPDLKNANEGTGIVATCGGSSICFIRIDDGEVALKYTKDSTKSKSIRGDDNLYAMAWSTLPTSGNKGKNMNILAAGGTRSRIILLHPDAGVCYSTFCTVPGKSNAVIASLLFHPKKPMWLFCGHEDGHIQIWDVDVPKLPTYKSSPVRLMSLDAPEGVRDVYNLVFSLSHDLLVAGYDGGLHVWKVDLENMEKEEGLDKTEFLLPDVDDSGFVVDSICLLRDDLLAVKCALHGFIYIFSLSKIMEGRVMKDISGQYKSVVLESLMLKLKWSDTDNFYMNMGVDPQSCLLVCGDDAGALWVYDLAAYVTGSISSPLNGSPPIGVVQPTSKLQWPDLEDPEVEKARKLQVTAYDIVMDKCAVSPGGECIVAVTSNNMVCIWKQEIKQHRNQ